MISTEFKKKKKKSKIPSEARKGAAAPHEALSVAFLYTTVSPGAFIHVLDHAGFNSLYFHYCSVADLT